MADSASDSIFQPDMLGLRRTSSSLFNIPGLFIGFSARGSLDSESTWSPTSPLDLSFFSNLSNPFGCKSPRLPRISGQKRLWDSGKVGLGIVNLLASEIKPTREVLDSPTRKNIIFGPKVKPEFYVGSNSSPRNIVISSLEASPPVPWYDESDRSVSDEGALLQSRPFINSSSTSSKLCLLGRATTIASLPLGFSGSQADTCDRFARSFSAREIELSEDYTRIISHGPNPKTTHIFGDCILDVETNELSNFGELENLDIELPQEADFLAAYPSDFMSCCCSCKKMLEKGDDIFICRGEKAFCSFDCRSAEIFAEEETGSSNNTSPHTSPGSSFHEDDCFVMGTAVTARSFVDTSAVTMDQSTAKDDRAGNRATISRFCNGIGESRTV